MSQPYIRGVGVPSGLNHERNALPARLRTPTPSGCGRGVSANREMLARTMEWPEFVYADGTYDYGPDPEQAGRQGAPVRIGRLGPVLVHAGHAMRLRYRLVVGSSQG